MIAELKPLAETTLANLLELTQDPIDAMRLAADVYAMTAYAAEQRLAERTGAPRPQAPRPTSKFLRGFLSHLAGWFDTMSRSLRPDEIERLKRIGAALVNRLNDDEPELLEDLFGLVNMAPPVALAWIRMHFDEVEARFA
ncbi:MAG: hypothetical protein M4D80_40550 [Myxococcota bacterium]|nr:hypothetical protein [Myxococcota bacterium]